LSVGFHKPAVSDEKVNLLLDNMTRELIHGLPPK
jgi:hypothetical protein